MKTNKALLTALFVLVTFLTGCGDNEIGNDATNPFQASTYIRILSPNGTNVLDDISIFPKETTHGFMVVPKDDVLNISVSKENSENVIKTWGAEYHLVTSEWAEYNMLNLSKDETILYVTWSDFDFTNNESEWNRSTYDDAYVVKLKSQKIFNDDNERTIKMFYHVKRGEHFIRVYKCEVDGVEHSLENDVIRLYKLEEDKKYGKKTSEIGDITYYLDIFVDIKLVK